MFHPEARGRRTLRVGVGWREGDAREGRTLRVGEASARGTLCVEGASAGQIETARAGIGNRESGIGNRIAKEC